jgi:hypothetical protein
MITTSEKATQKSITRPLRSVHHTNFLWASFACYEAVRSTTQRLVAVSGAGLPFLEISATSPRALAVACEWPPSRSRGLKVDAGSLRQFSQRSRRRVESFGQKRRVVAVGRGGDESYGDAASVHRHRALGAPLAPIYWAPTGLFATAFYALVMQQSTAMSESSRPTKRS